ncbi:MAG: OB-fold nucleic acid binding domain-containing protein [Candidatus Hodarchaeaceae archaeon]|nr:OB-fold nucleic acid binding domain-containing protein [Candidatus Hodarchaeaceae archaeon]
MRSTAYKLKIEDLVRGEYIRSPEGTEPSYLLTPWGQHVTRARVMGTVIDKFIREDQGYAALRIDDGSETISLRAWREGVPELDRFSVGDLVDVVGRVREFEGEIYLVPELLLRVEDPNWELVRELDIIDLKREALSRGVQPRHIHAEKPEPSKLKLELPQHAETAEPAPEEAVEEPPLPEVPDEIKKRVILAIEKLDKGKGVTPAETAIELNLPQAQVEDALRVIFVEGDVFEPTAGRFKLAR